MWITGCRFGQPQRRVHPHGQRERVRRRELGPVLQQRRAQRLVVVLGRRVFCSPIARSRSTGSAMSLASEENSADTLFAPGASASPCTDTGTVATSERVGQLVAVGEVLAQRARAHRQHDVVDRAAEGVLDLLDVVEAAPARTRRCGAR